MIGSEKGSLKLQVLVLRMDYTILHADIKADNKADREA